MLEHREGKSGVVLQRSNHSAGPRNPNPVRREERTWGPREEANRWARVVEFLVGSFRDIWELLVCVYW